MRTEACISFEGSNIPGGIEALLAAAGVGRDEAVIQDVKILKQITVDVTLPEGDARIQRLVAELEHLRRRHRISFRDRYTDEELDEAPLLILFQNEKAVVAGGSAFGTIYDLADACPTCGAGARQTSPLFLDGDPNELRNLTDHLAGCTYRDEVFVENEIATDLNTFTPSGLVIRDVYVRKPDGRRVKKRYKQIASDHILPPMSPLTQGIDRPHPCAACSRSGYWDGVPTPRVVYRKKDIENARDINFTWEQKYGGTLGENPLEWRIPVPWLVVKPKAMQVLSAAGVTELDWLPIRVVDE